MSSRFSRRFPTFEEWLAKSGRGGAYSARIARAHARYPTASLGQLRRHPEVSRSALSTVTRAPPSRIPISSLSLKERMQRRRALEIVSEARHGKGSLSALARAKGMSPRAVRWATGAFRKQGGRWVPTKSDRVERWLKSYEKGQRVEVLVKDSRTATLLSRYSNAVGHYLHTGDSSGLAQFEGRTYKDEAGKIHTFETDPKAIQAAVERSESDFGGFADLYSEPEEAGETA